MIVAQFTWLRSKLKVALVSSLVIRKGILSSCLNDGSLVVVTRLNDLPEGTLVNASKEN